MLGQTICIPCSGVKYTIGPGDSLWRISQTFGITVDEILSNNPQLTDPNNIVVGQIICIPEAPVREKRLSLSYLFGGTSSQYLDSVSQTKDSLDIVCPDFFDIDRSGNLLLATSEKLNKSFVDTLHSENILVVPFLSNHFDRSLRNYCFK